MSQAYSKEDNGNRGECQMKSRMQRCARACRCMGRGTPKSAESSPKSGLGELAGGSQIFEFWSSTRTAMIARIARMIDDSHVCHREPVIMIMSPSFLPHISSKPAHEIFQMSGNHRKAD